MRTFLVYRGVGTGSDLRNVQPDPQAVQKSYELLSNLLAGKLQTHWDHVICKMHECDSWAGANGTKHKGTPLGL